MTAFLILIALLVIYAVAVAIAVEHQLFSGETDACELRRPDPAQLELADRTAT